MKENAQTASRYLGTLKIKASQARVSISIDAHCYFTAAVLYGRKLAEIDVDPEVPLFYLCISHCNVYELRFTAKLPLQHLSVSHTPLLYLDTAHLPQLYVLELESVKLHHLSIYPVRWLKMLRIQSVPIVSLDLENAPLLTHLELLDTAIVTLDVDFLRNLQIVRLQAGYVSGLTNCLPKLRKLSVFVSKMQEISFKDCFDLEKIEIRSESPARFYLNPGPALRFVLIRGAAVSCLNTATLVHLKQLDLAYTQIAYLDVRALTELEKLFVGGTKIKFLDTKKLTKLKLLEIAKTCIARFSTCALSILKAASIRGSFVRFADFRDNRKVKIVTRQSGQVVATQDGLITWGVD